MNTYDIYIVQRPGDTHFGMELVDHNGEPISGEIKYNKYGVSIPYGIYDAVVAAIARLQAEVSRLKHNTEVIDAASGGDKNNINKLIAEKHQLSEAITACGSENKELHRKIDDLTAKYEELEQNFKEVCDELVAEQEKNMKLRDKFNKLHTSFKGLCSELIDEKEKSRDIGVVRDENKRLRADIADLRKETIRLTSELNKYQNKSIITQLKELAEKMHTPIITAKQEATYDEPISDSLREDDTITIKSDGDGTLYDIWRNTVLGQHHIGVLRVRFGMVGVFGTYFNRVSEINNIFTVSDLLKWVWSNPGTAYRFSIRRDK